MNSTLAITALVHIAQSVPTFAFASRVYGPDAGEDYLAEKCAHIRRDFLGWLCSLDSTRRNNFAAFLDELVSQNA